LEAKSGVPVVAVDLGGTNTRVAIVETDGTIRERDVEPTARVDDHPGDLVALIRRVAAGDEVERAVIGKREALELLLLGLCGRREELHRHDRSSCPRPARPVGSDGHTRIARRA
jgi:hypothetical protein